MVRCDICKTETLPDRIQIINSGEKVCFDCLGQIRSGQSEASQIKQSRKKASKFTPIIIAVASLIILSGGIFYVWRTNKNTEAAISKQKIYSAKINPLMKELAEATHAVREAEENLIATPKLIPLTFNQIITYLSRYEKQGLLHAKNDPAIDVVWCNAIVPLKDVLTNSSGGCLGFYPYLGVNRDGNYWTRLYISYRGRDWIFINRLTIMIDNCKIEVPLDHYLDVDSSVTIGAGLCEKIDLYGRDDLIRSIAAGNEVYISLSGQHRRQSWKLTKYDLIDFQTMVNWLDELDELKQNNY